MPLALFPEYTLYVRLDLAEFVAERWLPEFRAFSKAVPFAGPGLRRWLVVMSALFERPTWRPYMMSMREKLHLVLSPRKSGRNRETSVSRHSSAPQPCSIKAA